MTSIDDLLLLSDLHLTDLDANDKGKLRADAPLTDALLAQQFYRAELNTLKSCLLDAKLAASIDSALGTDAGVLAAIEEQNRLAERDAEIARRMQELLSSGRESQLRHLFAEYQCEELKIEPSRSAGPSNSGSTPSTTASGSKEFIKSTAASPAGRSSTTIKAPPHECVICTDSITSNPFKAPCGDTYCRKCIADLFLAATRDETLMPPRCCKKPIPLDLVTGMLTKAQIEAFEMKLLQYNTPDPMFCPNPSCASFIPPNAVKKPTTTCPSCSTNVCPTCKQHAHNEADCPADPATTAILRIAHEMGWKRCSNCHRMVELEYGCNHITCRCGKQFCYICGETWKNCTCELFSAVGLGRMAERRVLADPVARHQAPAAVANLVNGLRDRLRDAHECDHVGLWKYRDGGGRCEECSHWLPHYLFRCRGCEMLGCWRCRKNRL